MMGERGEPIRVPKICLYVMWLKEKKVKLIINLTAHKNSFSGIEVFAEITSHLFSMLS